MNDANFTASGLVAVEGDKVFTDSLAVARAFGKNHKEVLRSIKNMECSTGFAERNFALCFEINSLQNGKRNPFYKLTKDGFMFLAMGFTGKEAARWKERFIEAFNAMAAHIANQQQSLWQQMQALIAKEANSQVRASFGSHLMLQRKAELPGLCSEREALESEIQPSLKLH